MCLSLNAECMEIMNMPVCNCSCCLNCRVMTRASSLNANSKLTRLLIIRHPSPTLCGIFSGRLSTCHCHRPQSLNRPQGLHHNNVRNTTSKKLSGVVLAGWPKRTSRRSNMWLYLTGSKSCRLCQRINQRLSPPININANHTICWACVDCDLLQPTVCAERRCERSPAR